MLTNFDDNLTDFKHPFLRHGVVLYSTAAAGRMICVCRCVVATAVLGDYSRHDQQHQQRVESSLESRMMLDTDAGQSSYKRDADGDAEESFLLHTSWMDWRHGVPKQRTGRSTLIGQSYRPYVCRPSIEFIWVGHEDKLPFLLSLFSFENLYSP